MSVISCTCECCIYYGGVDSWICELTGRGYAPSTPMCADGCDAETVLSGRQTDEEFWAEYFGYA